MKKEELELNDLIVNHINVLKMNFMGNEFNMIDMVMIPSVSSKFYNSLDATLVANGIGMSSGFEATYVILLKEKTIRYKIFLEFIDGVIGKIDCVKKAIL